MLNATFKTLLEWHNAHKDILFQMQKTRFFLNGRQKLKNGIYYLKERGMLYP